MREPSKPTRGTKHSPESSWYAEKDWHFFGSEEKHHESDVMPVGLLQKIDSDDASMLDEIKLPWNKQRNMLITM